MTAGIAYLLGVVTCGLVICGRELLREWEEEQRKRRRNVFFMRDWRRTR